MTHAPHTPTTHSQTHSQSPTAAPLQDAATVLLLRDSADGLQVLLLRRHSASPVLGGAYVFPGGKLDVHDQHPDLHGHLSETPLHLRQRLHEPDLPTATAAGLFVAALREVFEESGVFLGTAGLPPLAATAATAATASTAATWHQRLQQLGAPLHTPSVQPWSRWVTPQQMALGKQRFDTRFFLAAMPEGQSVQHCQREATDSVWLTPRQALARYVHGSMALVAPQIMSLLQLQAHTNAASALQHAQMHAPVHIEPVAVHDAGQRVLCFPGDPCHPVPTLAMRGPTRLHLHEGRFYPPAGVHTLLD